MPPLPGRPELRQKKGKRATHAVLPREHDVPVPELPERDRPWHPMALRWWFDAWTSPMAVEWTSADMHGLTMLAELHHDFWTAERPRDRAALAAEIRLNEARFGLSPMDRRRLQWSIEQGETAAERTRQRRARTIETVDPDDDPRTRLGREWP